MFVTTPQFEDPTAQFEDPTAQFLGATDRLYWRAVMLTTPSPWYLLTYDLRRRDGVLTRNSMAIAWKPTLVSTIDRLGPDAIRGLCSIRLAESAQTWTMRSVQTLWLPASAEQETTGPFLFSFVADPLVYNSHYAVVPQDGEGRRLLMSLDASVLPGFERNEPRPTQIRLLT